MQKLTTARDVAGGILLGAVLALTLPRQLVAQHQTQLSVFGGVATDQFGRRSNAVGIAPTLSVGTGGNVNAQLFGSATRFTAAAWSFGGGASFSARDAIGSHVALALRGDGSVARLQGGGTGTWFHGELSPAL
jgi:hypothetical protein